MSDTPPPVGASQVETDYAKNKFFLIYFAVWGTVSVVLFGCSWYFEWGFWGWFGAVFALMVAVGGAAGMAKTGGAGVVECPSCGEQIKVLHISEHRIERCEHCRNWIEGAESMSVVPDDRVADHPAFNTYLPNPHAWPEGCAHCGEPATRELQVESSADAFGKYIKVRVPFCNSHDESSVWINKEGGGTFIYFHSLDYMRRFKQLNARQ